MKSMKSMMTAKKNFRFQIIGELLVLTSLMGCALEPTVDGRAEGARSSKGRQPSPNAFGAAPVNASVPSTLTESPQFRPRVLLVKAVMDPVRVPQDWQDFAERDLVQNITAVGSYVILRPEDVGMAQKDFMARGQWDFKKLQDAAKEKAIPLVLEWELAPLQIQEDSDPIGIARERRRRITVEIKTRMFDTRKGQLAGSDSGLFSQQEKEVIWWSKREEKRPVADYDRMTLEFFLRNAMNDLIPKLMVYAPKISWSGRVAMIKGDRLYLNVGQQSGVQVGDLLKVLEKGDEIFDPETGDSLGKVPGRMKGTLEIISFFGKDGSIAVVHSGAGFQENDAVEYY